MYNLNNLSIFDTAIIVLYVLVFLGIGYFSSKRIKTARDFTSAGKSLTWPMIAGSTIASALGSSTLMGNYQLIDSYGMSGLLMALSFYFGWWILIIMTRRLRSSGADSIPGYLELKYNAKTRKTCTLFVLLNAMVNIASQFMAFGIALSALGLCSIKVGAIIGAIVIIGFTIFSGLYGVALTDTLQSVLLLIGCGIIIPLLTFKTAGGWEFVFSNTPSKMLNPFTGADAITLIGYVLANCLVAACHCANSQRTFAAQDETHAVKGQLTGNILSIAVITLAVLPAFAMPFIYPNVTDAASYTTLYILDYLPIGIKGIMLALLFGLLLTTGDTFLLLFSSTIVDDVIRPQKPDMDDRKLLKIGRWIMVIVSVLNLLLAFYVNDLYDLFALAASTFGAAVFFPLILGVYWKKANAKAVNIGMLVGGLLSFVWDLTLNNFVNIRGVILGAALNGIICVVGSLIIDKNSTKGKKILVMEGE